MNLDGFVTTVVTVTMIVVLMRDLVAPSIAVLTGMISLLVLGVIEADQAFAGFANPAPITVAALFILARAVEKTGALQPLIRGTLERARGERWGLLRILTPTMAASAVFNNTPIVAMLVPQISAWARREGRSAAVYLMPISFAAILGGMVTLVGTSTNLIVSGLLEEAGRAPLGMFEITGVGAPLAVVGLVLIAALAPRILGSRQGPMDSFDAAFRE